MPEMSFIKCDLMSTAHNGVKQMSEPGVSLLNISYCCLYVIWLQPKRQLQKIGSLKITPGG